MVERHHMQALTPKVKAKAKTRGKAKAKVTAKAKVKAKAKGHPRGNSIPRTPIAPQRRDPPDTANSAGIATDPVEHISRVPYLATTLAPSYKDLRERTAVQVRRHAGLFSRENARGRRKSLLLLLVVASHTMSE